MRGGAGGGWVGAIASHTHTHTPLPTPHPSTYSDGWERADTVCINPQMAGLGTTVGVVVVKVIVRVPWVGLYTVTRKPLAPQIRLGVGKNF